jgi:hypothetical protein
MQSWIPSAKFSLPPPPHPANIHNRRGHHPMPSHIPLDSIRRKTSIQTVVLLKANRLPTATLFPMNTSERSAEEPNSLQQTYSLLEYIRQSVHIPAGRYICSAGCREMKAHVAFFFYCLIALSGMNFIVSYISNPSLYSNVL